MKFQRKRQINHYSYYNKKSKDTELIIEKRYKVLIIIIAIIMAILLFKIFYLQVIKKDYYDKQLTILTQDIIEGESTPRGKIYDRNGKVIVDNIGLKTISYKKPKGVIPTKEIQIAYKLANLIEVDYSKLSDDSLRDFWVKNNKEKANKKIKDEEWTKLEERKLTVDDIYELKKKRITDEELEKYQDVDKEAAYIYYLMNKGYSYAEKTIKNENVTDREYAIVAENIDDLDGVSTKIDWQRNYPYGSVFKSMLGNVSTSEKGLPLELKDYYLEQGYSLTDRVGTSYLEYQYESVLKGTKSTYKIMPDGSYKQITEGKRGNDIKLTIDIELQKEVENILTEELLYSRNEPNTEYLDKSFVVIIEPNTGEILAMAGKQIVKNSDGSYQVYDYTPGVITTSVTPGSIVKGASHIVGYNTGALKIGEKRNDACIKIAATPIKCSYRSYGYIDDLQALKYSSNTYQFHTAIKVGKANYVYNGPLKIDTSAFDTYRNTFAEFGLGVKTEIDLPNETIGYKGNGTLSGLLLDFSIGQYDNYTPIQIAQYISTIANGGSRVQPHLLKAVYEPTSKPLKKEKYKTETKVLNKVNTKEEYFSRIKEGFKQVMEVGGTGYGYIDATYLPAGKTGTAQSFLDITGDGKIDIETTTTNFVGYAPYDNPKVSFAVVSPDVGPQDVSYNAMSKINKRITQKVSKKYFEIYK